MTENNTKIFNHFFSKILTTKNPDDMLQTANKAGLERSLSAIDLIILGIGAIIGCGIFAAVGIAAAGNIDGTVQGAGPALVISMIIAAIACIFSALCYSEFATMIPVAGGAYTYTFATLGEFPAWMVGWVLVLEYLVGYIAVACAWSSYFMNFIKGFSNVLPACIVTPPDWLVGIASASAPHIGSLSLCFNLPALLMIVISSAILVKGTKDSTVLTTVMVVIKLAVIALFVITGLFYIQPENWTPIAPHGASGVFMGAFTIFFAYIGFDALATTAEECKNPQKDLPIGIIGSLIVTTIVYALVALVLTGMYDTSSIPARGFLEAPVSFVMNLHNQNLVAGLISVGALAGLTSVLLVMQLAATRILYAMSRDKFLPKMFQQLHPVFKTPHILTLVVGVVAAFGTLTLDLAKSQQLCNFGTFTSFIIICVAVLILRKTDPDRPRPFKVPFCPWFPLLGIMTCGGLMLYSLKDLKDSASLFIAWLLIGVVIYLQYGYIKNRKAEILNTEKDSINENKEYINQ